MATSEQSTLREAADAAQSTDAAKQPASVASAIPESELHYRIDGKPWEQNGKHYSRIVRYVRLPFVERLLDEKFGDGHWSVTYEVIQHPLGDGMVVAVKARIVGGMGEQIAEGIGYPQRQEDDPLKAAETDATKRAARHILPQLRDLWDEDGQWYAEVENKGRSDRPFWVMVGQPQYRPPQELRAPGTTSEQAPAEAAPTPNGPRARSSGGVSKKQELAAAIRKLPNWPSEWRDCLALIGQHVPGRAENPPKTFLDLDLAELQALDLGLRGVGEEG